MKSKDGLGPQTAGSYAAGVGAGVASGVSEGVDARVVSHYRRSRIMENFAKMAICPTWAVH